MSFRLRSCVWEITLACCFSCAYCGSKAGHSREHELTTDECLYIADQLAALGCQRVSLIGGEVFMRPDWVQIAKRLTGYGIKVPIITNGYLFKTDILKQMKEARIESVAVSVDGTESVHDFYRQAGSYKRAINAIQTVANSGIPVSVISTLNAKNVETLDDLYQQLISLPIFAWQLQACSPMGSAAASGLDYCFAFSKVISFVKEHILTSPFSIGIADNIGYYSEGEGTLRGNPNGLASFRGCQAGLTAIGIDSVGNVRGCESMYDDTFIEGNLRDRTLKDIWEDSRSFAYNRQFRFNQLTGSCASCRYGLYCAGGCRSYNYFVHGKLYESPYCVRREQAGTKSTVV